MDLEITKIEPQKKNKERYSIYSGEQFIFGVSQDTLIKFDLHTGKNLTADQVKKIKDTESDSKLRDQAYRFLSRRAHSQKELTDKLTTKGYSQVAIGKIIHEFVQRGYINDTDFAKMFIEEEINLKKSGPLLIKNKLIKKGVLPDIIDGLLTGIYNAETQSENCLYLFNKKYRNFQPKQKNAVINYLRGKGYFWEQISAVIPETSWGNNNEE